MLKDKPKYTEGIVRKRMGQMVDDVLWDGTTLLMDYL
jgi:hypothetical protein